MKIKAIFHIYFSVLFCYFFIVSAPAFSDTVQVVKITEDNKIVVILKSGGQKEVKLSNVVFPSHNVNCAQKSKQFLESALAGKIVSSTCFFQLK